MKTLKKFLIYIICIAAFWILSDVLIYLAINGTYQKKEAKVLTISPEVIVEQCAATHVNGMIRGKIKNNTGNIITNQYVKIDIYSSRNVKLGTKYIPIENLQTESIQNFEMWYRFSNADYLIVTVDDKATNASEEEFVSQKTWNDLLVVGLAFLIFI